MADLSLLAELQNAQNAAYVNLDNLPWTAAKPKDFLLLSLFLQGIGEMADTFTSGPSIRTQFDPKIYSSNFAPKRFAEDHKRGGESAMQFMETGWVEYEWNTGIRWHDIHLQGNGPFSPDGSQRYYSILEKREKDFVLDPLIKMEKALAAVPTADMFSSGANGRCPVKSLWTMLNVWETRHGVAGENLFAAQTDQQGLDPEDPLFQRQDSYGTTYTDGGSQLAPTKVKYAAAGDTKTGADHLIDQLQYMIDVLSWDGVPMAGKFADGRDVNPKVICTTREGTRLMRKTLRAHDNLFAVTNPIGDMAQQAAQFSGIPMMESDTLRDAAIYPDISGGVAGAAAATPLNERDTNLELAPADGNGGAGGYYYFIDPENIKMYFHSERAWETGPWKTLEPQNEDEMRRLGKFLGNMHAEAFVTSGILLPSNNIADYA